MNHYVYFTQTKWGKDHKCLIYALKTFLNAVHTFDKNMSLDKNMESKKLAP